MYSYPPQNQRMSLESMHRLLHFIVRQFLTVSIALFQMLKKHCLLIILTLHYWSTNVKLSLIYCFPLFNEVKLAITFYIACMFFFSFNFNLVNSTEHNIITAHGQLNTELLHSAQLQPICWSTNFELYLLQSGFHVTKLDHLDRPEPS